MMSVCSNEENAFVFNWRIENCTSNSDTYIFSPEFLVQALHKTAWYCWYEPEFGFMVERARVDDGPEKIEIRARMSLLRTDGTYLEGRVEESALKKRDSYVLLLKKTFEDVVSISGCMQVRLHMWNASEENSEFPCERKELISYSTSGNRVWLKEEFPRTTATDMQHGLFAKSCTGVTRCYAEEVEARLDPDILRLLRERSDLFILAESASGRESRLLIWCAKEPNSEKLRISIRKVKNGPINIQCHSSCKLVEASGEVIDSRGTSFVFDDDFSELPTFIKMTDLFTGENENCSRYLLITCNQDQTFIEQTSYASTYTVAEQIPKAIPHLQHNILRLYREGLYCDFTLNMVDGTLGAHKTVLESCSPVFEAMINHDTVEKSKSAKIEDVDRDTMERFLEFLYTDSVQDLDWGKAARLYYAAHKYKVLPLKNICSSFLTQHLSKENVYEVLALVDRHEDEELKSSVVEFMLNVENDFFDTQEWEEFASANSKLANDVMKNLYKSAVAAHQERLVNLFHNNDLMINV